MSYSWLAVALMSSGTLAVLLVLGLFATGRRYLRAPGPDKGVRFAQARVACEDLLHSLSSSLLEMDERERSVTGCLRAGEWSSDERSGDAETLLREADVSRLWRRFATASSLAEHDPEQARTQLEALQPLMEEASSRLAEAERACRKTDSGLPYR